MKAPLSYVPLLPVFVAQVSGVLLCRLWGWDYMIAVLLIVSVGALSVKRFYLAAFSGAVAIGWICGMVGRADAGVADRLSDDMTFEGVVESVGETSRGRSIDVEVIGLCRDDSVAEPVKRFGMRVATESLLPEISAGDMVRFHGRYSSVFSRKDLPDEFDMSAVLLNKGISARAFVRSEDLEVVGKAGGIYWKLRRYRDDIADAIYDSGLSDGASSFLCATLVGDSGTLSADQRRKFSVNGQAHILALSGAHVVLIATIMSVLLFPLTFFGFSRWRLVLTIAALWIFAVVTGLMPSVTRAVIMTTVVMGAYLLHRRNSSMNALIAAAILIVTFDSNAVFQIGFQLSFAAVASIILLNDKVNFVSPRRHVLHGIVGLVMLPLVAMLGTVALSTWYFHVFPVYFLLASVPVSFLFTAIVWGGVVVLMADMMHIGHQWLDGVVDWLYDMMMAVMDFNASLPCAVIENIYPEVATVTVFMGLPVVLAGWLAYRRRVWGLVFCAMLLTCVAVEVLSGEDFPERELYITRETLNTNIVIRCGTEMKLISTANPTLRESERDKCAFKYSDYMGRRGVASIEAVSKPFSSRDVTFSENILYAGGKSFVIIKNDEDLRRYSRRPDYALVCRGFRGEMEDVVVMLSPATVILSYDLHPHRHDRYMVELKEMNADVFSLRENGAFCLLF